MRKVLTRLTASRFHQGAAAERDAWEPAVLAALLRCGHEALEKAIRDGVDAGHGRRLLHNDNQRKIDINLNYAYRFALTLGLALESNRGIWGIMVMSGRIKELDGLRAIAVGMVVAGHCSSVLPRNGEDLWLPIKMFANGYSGVLVFFVLSGFLITRILLTELNNTGKIALKIFYWHRAVRIFPASYAYIFVVATLGLLGVSQVSLSQIIIAASHLWNYNFLLVANGPFQGGQALGHFWSLALEEQFYWVWPLLILSIGRHRPKFLLGVILAMPVIRVTLYVFAPELRTHLNTMFHTSVDPIAMGALLACYESQAKRFIVAAPEWFINSCIGMLFIVAPLMHMTAKGYWLITYGLTIEICAAAVLIITLIYKPEHWSSAILRKQPFQYFGMISFSLYLWQQMFCIKGAPLEMMPYFSIPAAIAAASASFYLIERPSRRWRNALSAKAIG